MLQCLHTDNDDDDNNDSNNKGITIPQLFFLKCLLSLIQIVPENCKRIIKYHYDNCQILYTYDINNGIIK